MDNDFVSLLSVIGEPSRAKIVWRLLDGKAYTAGELAMEADVSKTAVSNHLNKMLESRILKVEAQGRHRYYSFYNSEVAYAIEAIASVKLGKESEDNTPKSGERYCRSCYDHLAGEIGVKITQALVEKGVLQEQEKEFSLLNPNSDWINSLGIVREELTSKKRAFARKCLDWSERKPHLAGHLGALFLHKMIEKNWVRKVKGSREIVLTTEGKKQIFNLLDLNI